MLRRSAGSFTLAMLALLVVAAGAGASPTHAARVWFRLDRLPLAHATRLGAATPSQTMQSGRPDAAAGLKRDRRGR